METMLYCQTFVGSFRSTLWADSWALAMTSPLTLGLKARKSDYASPWLPRTLSLIRLADVFVGVENSISSETYSLVSGRCKIWCSAAYELAEIVEMNLTVRFIFTLKNDLRYLWRDSGKSKTMFLLSQWLPNPRCSWFSRCHFLF